MGSSLSVIRRDNRREPHFRTLMVSLEAGSEIDQLPVSSSVPRVEKPKGRVAKTGKPARSFAARHGVLDPRGIS